MLNRAVFPIALVITSFTLSACGGAGAGAYGSSENPIVPVAADPVTPASTTPVGNTPLQSPAPSSGNTTAPSPYAGNWRATYDGVDKGSCAPVAIDAGGLISGPCFSSIGNPGSFLQGSVAADGKATISFASATATVTFGSSSNGTGTWTSFAGGGTITFDRVN